MLLLRFSFCLSGGGGISSGGGRCVYLVKGSKKFSVSFSKLIHKNGNLFMSVCRFGGSGV